MGVPPGNAIKPSSQRFADEGDTDEKGSKLQYIKNDQGADRRFEYFVPDTAQGLTQSGLSRLNQSIEAFVYCVLGTQVNVRSSILGNGGRAKEAQRDFLVLLEGAIRTPDISKSVQRYQLAIDKAKVRLNFVAAPRTWLMPSRMIINTGSVTGYNNQLKHATQGMKLGINNDVNNSTKKAGLHLMAGGPTKINPPNSLPSNPIHKAATKTDPKPTAASATQTKKIKFQPLKQNSQSQRSKQKNKRQRQAPAVSLTMQTK